MISINTAYQFLQLQANKNFGGGFTVPRFNLAWEQAEKSFFWELIGFDTRSQGNNYSNNRFAVATQSNLESLRPFYVSNLLITPVNGVGQLPSDYAYIDTLLAEFNVSGTYKKREVVQIDNGTQGFVFNSSLLEPTTDYPKFEFVNNTIKVYPSTNAVYLNYWRVPVKGEWKFITQNGRPVYDPATSVNSEFNDKDSNELVARVAKLLGINIKDGELLQFAQQNIQAGS